jgi:hypothetical protein
MYVQRKPDLSATGSAIVERERNWRRSLGRSYYGTSVANNPFVSAVT